MSKNIPTNKALYARVKAEAKKKFDRWPSAYGSAWLVREYKKRGGGYRKAEEGMEVPDYGYGGGMNYADYAYMYGGEDTDMMEYAKGGGIPERYKNKGFTKVGAKKKSTRPGKKWMVLAKKGDKYKIVHGGDSNMKDFKQHGSNKRKKRFWDRMGGRDSAKAKDPFSPLYWHKRFGTWEEGGEIFNEDSMDFYAQGGGIDNPGFKALPPEVQQNILDNMGIGGECYACGGQKKYQFAGQTMENPFTQEELGYMTSMNQEPNLEYLPYPDDTGDLAVMYPNPFQNLSTNTGSSNPSNLEYLPYPDDIGNLAVMYPNPNASIADASAGVGAGSNVVANDLPKTLEEAKALGFVDENGEPKAKTKKQPMDPKLQWAMGRIAMANAANQVMENIDDRKREAKMRQNLLTDNFVPMQVGNDRGEYDINTGVFMPDQYTSVQFQSQMAKGGQIGVVDDELLKELIAAGADIEILD